MRRPVTILAFVMLALLVLGLGLTYLSKSRDQANHAGCMNNLRVLSLLGSRDAKPVEVWPGTIPNAALPPDERLSWVVLALPTLSQPNAEDLAKSIDRKAKWNAPANREPSTKHLRNLLCPGFVPPMPANEPVPTMYVGIAGMGADAAALPETDPRAGAFRYDAPTAMAFIIAHDGVSQTLLYGQTVYELGPWIRGGPSTVRGLLDSPLILARSGGQFGGAFEDGGYFSFCDGSVKLFRYGTDATILKALATVNGGPIDFD